MTARVGMHGDALEVPASSGASRDGVRDRRICRSVGDAEPDGRGGVQRVDQSLGLKLPKVVECESVELEDGGTVDPPRSSQGRLGVAHRGDVVYRVLQQMEALTNTEAGIHERQRVGRGERARDDGGVAGAAQVLDPLLDVTQRWWRAFGEHEMRDVDVSAPRRHSSPTE